MSACEGGTQGPLTGNVADAFKGQVERRLPKLLSAAKLLKSLAFDTSAPAPMLKIRVDETAARGLNRRVRTNLA